MWNKSKSLMLSIFCTRLFLVLLAIVVVFAPQVIRWFFGESEAMLSIHGYLRATIYAEAVPAAAILLCLLRSSPRSIIAHSGLWRWRARSSG